MIFLFSDVVVDPGSIENMAQNSDSQDNVFCRTTRVFFFKQGPSFLAG